MQHDRRGFPVVAPPTDQLEQPTVELRFDELDEQQVVELPEREAISIVNGSIALPAAASAGLLSGG